MAHTQRRLEILREKADAGDARAQYELGLTFYRGDGVPQDMKEARVWLVKAADQGQRDAQVLLNLEGLRLDQGVQFKLGKALPKKPVEPGVEIATRKNVSVSVPLGGMKLAPSPIDTPSHVNPPPPRGGGSGDKHDTVAGIVDAIEAELRRLGWWNETPPTKEQMAFTAAFAMDTMPLAMWVQFVLLPRVRSIIAERGAFPSSSMVGAHAVREFDGQDEAARLVGLLSEFDDAVMR